MVFFLTKVFLHRSGGCWLEAISRANCASCDTMLIVERLHRASRDVICLLKHVFLNMHSKKNLGRRLALISSAEQGGYKAWRTSISAPAPLDKWGGFMCSHKFCLSARPDKLFSPASLIGSLSTLHSFVGKTLFPQSLLTINSLESSWSLAADTILLAND